MTAVQTVKNSFITENKTTKISMITHKIIADTQNALAEYLHSKKVVEDLTGALRAIPENEYTATHLLKASLYEYKTTMRKAKGVALLNMSIMKRTLEDDNS